jgi:hypothetical protein
MHVEEVCQLRLNSFQQKHSELLAIEFYGDYTPRVDWIVAEAACGEEGLCVDSVD